MKAIAPLLCLLLTACVGAPINPSFDVTVAAARADLERMRAEPVAPERPILIAGGYFDPGVASGTIARVLRGVLEQGASVATVNFVGARTFDECRRRLLDEAERSFAPGTSLGAVEIDVVGVSMGGLVARHAALPDEEGRRVRIRRLFTLASPHRGAEMADLPSGDRRVKDMRIGSAFLERIEAAPRDYEVIPYVRLGDRIVGIENTAPDGWAWWLPNMPFQAAHMNVYRDPRIHADIARRLRGEPPWTRPPATAPP